MNTVDNTVDKKLTAPDSPSTGEYVVVARRYRPQHFEELVGQDQVSQALQNAINTNRVGHAYLFTGSRGVGKTSAARILAKALVCKQGPTPTPCNVCDICLGVAVGDDVDVHEIDGASNRGIDEIRQLRSNVNVRPSRAHFKIYIIDEVHMLTSPAFNALLKTLEEPPEHVKFIFCTTDPERIPTTVLSRCQRFDFAGIRPDAIVQRLQQIVEAEGVEIEPAALQLLARRAAGSMRDSQSLLEQLLAFGSDRINVNDVHQMLGTAGATRLFNLVTCMLKKDAGAAIRELDLAIQEGVDPGPLLDQLLGYFRDMMSLAVGCDQDLLLHCSAAESGDLEAVAEQFGLETILAAIQILDQTAVRLRQSTHGRILLEMATVRIAKLADLVSLGQVIHDLQQGNSAGVSQGELASKKKTGKTSVGGIAERVKPPSLTPVKRNLLSKAEIQSISSESAVAVLVREEAESVPVVKGATAPSEGLMATPSASLKLNDSNALTVWKSAVSQLDGLVVDQALKAETVAISAPNQLTVGFPRRYNSCKTFCESADRLAELEQVLLQVTGQSLRLRFNLLDDEKTPQVAAPPVVSRRQQMRELASHPTVRHAIEIFDAELVRIDHPRDG